jgi:hypothetical protein
MFKYLQDDTIYGLPKETKLEITQSTTASSDIQEIQIKNIQKEYLEDLKEEDDDVPTIEEISVPNTAPHNTNDRPIPIKVSQSSLVIVRLYCGFNDNTVAEI